MSSIRRAHCAAIVLACLSGSSLADGPVLSSPLKISADQPLAYATELKLDQQSLEALRSAGDVVLSDFVLPGGRVTTAHVHKVDALAPGARVVVSNGKNEAPLDLSGMIMLAGTIDSDPTARLFLSFSPAGINGFIRGADGTTVISSGPVGQNRAPIVYRMGDLPADAISWIDMPCGLDRLTGGQTPVEAARQGNGNTRAGPCRLANIAIETDWEYTSNIFGGDTTASAAYAVTLLAADSEIYQTDINTRLQVGFLRVWSTSDDPYTTTDNYERLFEFQDYWNANMTGITRHTAHFLAGVLGSTGGVAYLPGLCQFEYDYGLSSYLNGFFPYPLENNNGQNWDLMVTSHEIGHNFGAPHTHDVGIDGCGLGDCSHASEGTIMSYCHTCSGGMTNIALTLHQQIINNNILPYLANDAPCSTLDDGVLISQQPQDVTAPLGEDAVFSVSASTTSGSPGYQWHKGTTPLSDNGHYAGVTTASLTIHDASPADSDDYNVVVTGSCGSETSDNAFLSIDCPADFDNSGFVDTDDYDTFVQAFEIGGDDADFDHSGFVDLDDFNAFVHSFEAGC